MIWKRLASNCLKGFVEHFSAVLLLGARQVGKTTLARLTFPNAETLDLESLMGSVAFCGRRALNQKPLP
jgi:predicted kinase